MGNQSQNWWLKGVGPHDGRAERTLRSPNLSPKAKAVYPQVLAISTGGFSHLPSVFSSLRGDNEKVSTFSPVSLLLGEHHRHEAGGGGMLCRADGHGLAQTWGQGIIGEKMRCSSPLLCLGVARAALSQQSRRLVGVSHKGIFGALKPLRFLAPFGAVGLEGQWDTAGSPQCQGGGPQPTCGDTGAQPTP